MHRSPPTQHAAQQICGPCGRFDAKYSAYEIFWPIHAQFHWRLWAFQEDLLIHTPGAGSGAISVDTGEFGDECRGGK